MEKRNGKSNRKPDAGFRVLVSALLGAAQAAAQQLPTQTPPTLTLQQAEMMALQNHPQIHGGPRKAVLIVASEVVDELTARGYPLFYGALGENLTTSGLSIRDIRVLCPMIPDGVAARLLHIELQPR